MIAVPVRSITPDAGLRMKHFKNGSPKIVLFKILLTRPVKNNINRINFLSHLWLGLFVNENLVAHYALLQVRKTDVL